jgi:YD repeat-containing protein
VTKRPRPSRQSAGLARSLLVGSLVGAAVGVLPAAALASGGSDHSAAGPWVGGAGLAPAPGVHGGGAISRAEVIRRAQDWVDRGVPYSQLAYWQDVTGSYRQDCSGYVSMAWGLDQSVNYWTGNLDQVSRPVAAAALAPGDVLLSDTHVVIFAGWADAAHTRFNLYEEAFPGTSARYLTGAALADYLDRGFQPRAYARILDSSVPASVPPSQANAGSAPAAPAAPTPASWAALDALGARHAFTIRPDGRLWATTEAPLTPPGVAPAAHPAGYAYGAWQDLGNGGPALTGEPVAVGTSDGALWVFALGADGHLWQIAQTKAGGAFDRWRDLGNGGTPLAGAPTALTTADGAVQVFAVDQLGRVVTARQPAGGAAGPGAWAYRSLGNGGIALRGAPVAMRTATGEVALVAIDSAGHVWSASQAAGGGTFAPWQRLADPGTPITTTPTLVAGHSGALELFAVDGRGRLLATQRTGPDAPFGPWRDLGDAGSPFAGRPTAVRTATGHVQLFVRDAAGHLASTWETPGSATGFGPWQVMGNNGINTRDGVFDGTPVADLSPTGGVGVVVPDHAGQLWSSAQSGPWQAFSPWQDLGHA